MTDQAKDIISAGLQIDRERRTPRERYSDLLEALAHDQIPTDAGEQLADVLADLRASGHEPDPTADLQLFKKLQEAEALVAQAKAELDTLPDEATIRDQVRDLDRDIAAEVEQLPSMTRKRELLAQIEPRRGALYGLRAAESRRDHAKREVTTIIDRLAPKAQRIDPRRINRQ